MHRLLQYALILCVSIFLAGGPSRGSLLAQGIAEREVAPPIHILEFHSAEDLELHYLHSPASGDSELAAGSPLAFPFRYVRSKWPLTKATLDAPEIVSRLIRAYQLDFDAERIDGACQASALEGGGASVDCIVDARNLSAGRHFVALYHPETMALIALSTTTPPSVGVVALDFHTYSGAWLRFLNQDDNGEHKLDIEGFSQYPARFVSGSGPRHLKHWEKPGAIDNLFQQDEGAVGSCKTDSLSPDSMDIVCAPGVCSMPQGNVFLVLYHPTTLQVVAVTETIDNTGGRAARAAKCPQPPPAPAQSAPTEADPVAQSAPVEAAPAVELAPNGCGPYAPGQWIPRADYEASGLNLPINSGADARHITDYKCIALAGEIPYLQAYPLYYKAKPARQAKVSDERDDDDDDRDNRPKAKRSNTMMMPASTSGMYCLICDGSREIGYIYTTTESKDLMGHRCAAEKARREANGENCSCELRADAQSD